MSRMEEFKLFVNKYPLIRNEVKDGKTTWQDIYNEWVLFGETKDYEKFKETTTQESATNTEQTNTGNMVNMDSIKSIMNYVKKLNPDQVNKTLGTVQKVLQIVQNVGPKPSVSIPPLGGLYSDWWD